MLKRSHLAFALIALSGPPGCGPTGPVAVTPVEWCLELVRMNCVSTWTCCPNPARIAEFTTPLARCETPETLEVNRLICEQLYSGVWDRPEFMWDGVAAAADLERRRAAVETCAVYDEAPPTPSLSVGDQCAGAGLPAVARWACPSGTFCSGETFGFCTARSPIGSSCDPEFAQCVDEAYCASDSVCYAASAVGGRCPCLPGLRCDATDTCVVYTPVGGACASDSECVSGTYPGGVALGYCQFGFCNIETTAEATYCH